MRSNKGEQQALVGILTKLYGEIHAIEQTHGIQVGSGDFRARIEYFHDAIRALTSGSDDVYGAHGRLSVESLAYDIAMLRHIQAVPLHPATTHRQQSPSKTVAVKKPNAVNPDKNAKGIDRQTKQLLADLYKNYAVLFAALLAEPADKNYQSRIDEMNNEVEELAIIQQLLQDLAAGKGQGQEQVLEAHILQLDNETLKHMLMAILHQRTQKKLQVQSAMQKMSEQMRENDRQIAAVEKAHMNYCTAQLAVYEDAKEVIKTLAMQGMNLVGKFVESAMQQAQRGAAGRNR